MQTEVMIKKQVSVFANITDLHKALSISIRKRIGRFMQRHVNQFGSNGRSQTAPLSKCKASDAWLRRLWYLSTHHPTEFPHEGAQHHSTEAPLSRTVHKSLILYS